MNRREYLGLTATALGAGAIAGCVGSGAPDEGATGTTAETTEGTGTTNALGTRTTRPSLARRSFEVTRNECGNETNGASVAFHDEVVVTGTITGTDACATGTLKETGYRDGAFRVVVGTEKETVAGACAECLVEIEYEARFAFEGGVPATVVVEHESLGKRRRVARASASASTSAVTSTSTSPSS